MATVPRTVTDEDQDIAYPTRDGRPMGETDLHRNKMADLIETLEDHFSGDPDIYVSGNLLVFYECGDRRKHVSPDVFVVRGVPKKPLRDHYLICEGKAPEFVIEVTSKSTRGEDQRKKPILYRDVLKVAEYFLFDPTEDYLKPPFQGLQSEPFRVPTGRTRVRSDRASAGPSPQHRAGAAPGTLGSGPEAF